MLNKEDRIKRLEKKIKNRLIIKGLIVAGAIVVASLIPKE